MENIRGIGLMVLAMAGFALADMFIKSVSSHIPVGEILLFIGTGGTLFFAAMAGRNGEAVVSRDLFSGLILLRTLGEMAGTFGFVTALVLIPISTASAILQATPLAVTLGAALFMGEAHTAAADFRLIRAGGCGAGVKQGKARDAVRRQTPDFQRDPAAERMACHGKPARMGFKHVGCHGGNAIRPGDVCDCDRHAGLQCSRDGAPGGCVAEQARNKHQGRIRHDRPPVRAVAAATADAQAH